MVKVYSLTTILTIYDFISDRGYSEENFMTGKAGDKIIAVM
ncbi:hypothetical protein MIDIC_500020 [Alphaproteobacteria bacterium]